VHPYAAPAPSRLGIRRGPAMTTAGHTQKLAASRCTGPRCISAPRQGDGPGDASLHAGGSPRLPGNHRPAGRHDERRAATAPTSHRRLGRTRGGRCASSSRHSHPHEVRLMATDPRCTWARNSTSRPGCSPISGEGGTGYRSSSGAGAALVVPWPSPAAGDRGTRLLEDGALLERNANELGQLRGFSITEPSVQVRQAPGSDLCN